VDSILVVNADSVMNNFGMQICEKIEKTGADFSTPGNIQQLRTKLSCEQTSKKTPR
jgi:hypothetical protein